MKNTFLQLVATALIAAFLTLANPAAAASKGKITIGTHNWPENIAVANMWKIILERDGYQVELVDSLKAAAYSGVANGDLDIGLEVWMPDTDRAYYERFKDRITLHDAWYRGTRVGLVVPTGVDVDSIAQLNAKAGEFLHQDKPTIYGIESGSSIMGQTQDAIGEYGLKFELLTSSSPAMTAALQEAIQKHQPIVVTLWSPHWAFAKFDLKYLGDPKGVYGEAGTIVWMSGNGFAKQYPRVTRWLDRWEMSDAELGGLMNMIRESGNPGASVREWITQNQALVDSWTKAD